MRIGGEGSKVRLTAGRLMTGHDGRRATCLILLILVQTSISAASEKLVTDHIESELTRPDHVVFSGPGMLSETDIDSTSGLIRGPFGSFDPLERQNWYQDEFSDRYGYGGLIIVQSQTSDLTGMIESVESRGAIFQEFYPDNAAIFSLDVNQLSRFNPIIGQSNDENIRWVSPLPASFRIEPQLVTKSFDSVSVELHLIRGLSSVDIGQLEFIIKDSSGDMGANTWCDDRLCRVEEISPITLARLLADDRVLYISEAADLETFDSISRSIIGLPSSEIAPPLDYDGTGEIISITDTGLDGDHQSLSDNIRAVYNQFGPDNSAADSNSGHGTHITGIIVGNGTLDNQTLGIAPAAEVNFYQIEYDTSGLLARWGTLYSMFSHSLQNQARTHTNAWGSVNQPGQYTADSHSADSFIVDQPAYLAIFSGGDIGQNQGATTTPPGTAKNVLTIGASTTGMGGTDPQGSVWSNNSGGTLDGRVKPDLVAPGVEICSARASEATSVAGSDCSIAIDQDATPLYVTGTGSSMATAVASGAALIVREYLGQELGLTEPDASLVKAMLINGATDLGQPDIPNPSEGWGELNVKQSIDPYDGSAKLDLLIDTGRGLGPGDALVQQVDVQGSKLDITLVWTDQEGSVSASDIAPKLVNNLDLIVTSPSGSVYAGNSFFQGFSTISTSSDNLNNVERVRIEVPEVGVWKVEVRSSAGVFQDGYSLVISGDAQWVDHSDLTTSPESLRITNDVIFEGEQLLIQMKWRNEGNIATGNYDVEIYDVTEQQSISTITMPPLGPGETETWSVQHAFASVGSHMLELRLDSLSDVIESNDELVGTDNNIAHLEVMISKQGLVIIPLDANGNEVPPEEHGEASSRLLEVLSTTTATFDFKVKNIGTSEATISVVSTPVKQLMENGALSNPSDEWTRVLSDSGPITLAANGQMNDNVSISISMIDETADPTSDETPVYAVPGTFVSRVVVRDIQNPTILNSRSFSVLVPRVEGVQILASGLDDFSALPGEFASFDMSVLNTGNGPTEYVVDCQSQSGWATRIDSILSESISLPELARLEYVTIPIQVLVPQASAGLPAAGHVETVDCIISSPNEGGPAESLSTVLIVKESRRFETMLMDDAQSPLPPLAAAPDRQILNMVAIDTMLEIENIGNIHQTISMTISLSESTWDMEVIISPNSAIPTAIESFDGSSSFEFVLQGGSSKIILVSVTAPPSASMGERALLSFRTTEGNQLSVVDSTRFVLEATPELGISSLDNVEALSGELTEIPLSIINSGNVALDLSWSFFNELDSWSTALQSITPTSIQPNQELDVMLGINIPDNWPVDSDGKIVTVYIEGTNPELATPSILETKEITVKVIETCSFEVNTTSRISVDSGDSIEASILATNTGNSPSRFSIEFSQDSNSLDIQNTYNHDAALPPGESATIPILISATEISSAGRELIVAEIQPASDGCFVVESDWDVYVDILPASDDGITNSLPPFVLPLAFILSILALSLVVVTLRRTSPKPEDPGEELIPQGSALMQGEASKRRMNALSTNVADETLSTSVSQSDLDSVLMDSLPKLDLPPLPRINSDEENSD